jgi:hypothetical protein
MRNKREPNFTTDLDGREIVVVPLACGSKAKLFAEDFYTLKQLGLSDNWFLNSAGTGRPSYVRCFSPRTGNVVSISRVIVGAGSRKVVKCIDNDRTNLRRDNLHLTTGNGGARVSTAGEEIDA